MWSNSVLCVLSLLFQTALLKDSTLDDEMRTKRQINSLPLVYPYGATYKEVHVQQWTFVDLIKGAFNTRGVTDALLAVQEQRLRKEKERAEDWLVNLSSNDRSRSPVKFIVGFSSPVPTKDDLGLSFAVNFQYQYSQFTNITQLSQYYVFNEISREQREADWAARRDERLTFYRAMAELLNTKGFNGVECVLRAICEAAQYPVEEEGLVGELIHILLTPDYGRTPFDDEDPSWEDAMAVYKDAAIAGRQMFSCSYIYNGCPEGQGVMEFISILRDE